MLPEELPAYLESMLRNILDYVGSVDVLITAVRSMDAVPGEVLVLTLEQAKHVALHAQTSGDVDTAVTWARFLLSRRDVRWERGHELEIGEFLEHLSYSRRGSTFGRDEASTWVSRFDIASTG